ncbi:zinc finger protein ZAT2-like [Tasmannia lanceolata]|uniref:zinc finger protein ZAT2-like n=1 Tax=Tasmannia lanceolata TaxID=3420 RepID=UPI00406283DC
MGKEVHCTKCDKQFPSRKSLLGHMPTHPDRNLLGINPILDQPNQRPRSTETKQELDTAGFLLMLSSGKRRKKNERDRTRFDGSNRFIRRRTGSEGNGIHECCICGRVFETGQALGGHKRCHWRGEEKVNRVRDGPVLDLNEPAPVSDEDLEAVHDMRGSIVFGY